MEIYWFSKLKLILFFYTIMKINHQVIRKLRLFVAFLLMLLSAGLFAQDNNLFVGVQTGPSFPMGKYHQTQLEEGSFAITGYYIAVDGIWYFKPKFGLGISGSMQQHPVDVGLLGYEKVKADPFMEDLYIRSEAYLMLTGLAGLYFRENITPKLHFQANAMGGILYGKTPWQLYKQQFFLVGLQYGEITSAKDWNWAGKAGIGFRYDISSCFGLILDIGINYSNLSFAFNSSSGTRIENRQILFLNSGIGIQFNL